MKNMFDLKRLKPLSYPKTWLIKGKRSDFGNGETVDRKKYNKK